MPKVKKLKKWKDYTLVNGTYCVYDDISGKVYKKGPKDRAFVPVKMPKKWRLIFTIGDVVYAEGDLPGEVYKKGPNDKMFVLANESETLTYSKARKEELARHKQA